MRIHFCMSRRVIRPFLESIPDPYNKGSTEPLQPLNTTLPSCQPEWVAHLPIVPYVVALAGSLQCKRQPREYHTTMLQTLNTLTQTGYLIYSPVTVPSNGCMLAPCYLSLNLQPCHSVHCVHSLKQVHRCQQYWRSCTALPHFSATKQLAALLTFLFDFTYRPVTSILCINA